MRPIGGTIIIPPLVQPFALPGVDIPAPGNANGRVRDERETVGVLPIMTLKLTPIITA